MQVPFLDLQAQYKAIQPEIDASVLRVLQSQHFILGPEVERCEQEIAEYCGCAYACGVSSGTDALLLALMAEGIGRGDEVITTAYTFFATAGSIARTGATPVFVDINAQTCNIDPQKIESRITKRTKAIIVVHLFGQMTDMDPILDIARAHNLVVIEDAAQAIGAEYQGKRAGSLGHYGCFSFFPSKNLGAAGDGGMVVTSDQKRVQKLKILRSHGAQPKYFHTYIGGNFRLDALQATIVRTKLQFLDNWIEQRQKRAHIYNRLLHSIPMVQMPHTRMQRHTFNSYIVQVPKRNALMAFLTERGIQTQIYYPLPLHLQQCFSSLRHKKGDFPVSEKAAQETLALPIYPELTNQQQEYVVCCIREFYQVSPVPGRSLSAVQHCSCCNKQR